MSAVAVGGALARLREAAPLLRERRATDTLAALADVLDALGAEGSVVQRALVDALPPVSGFHSATLREGLARGLAAYTGEALRALVRAELGGPEALEAGTGPRASGFGTTAQVLGGAIPLPAVVAVVAPLALRSPVLVKASAHDPVTAPLLARALAERDPLLGACVEVVDFRRGDENALAALCEAECLVATGSDAAIGALRARFQASGARSGRPRRFVGHGSGFSLALLGPGATRGAGLARAADALALDVALWDQLGCLSPVSIHTVDPDPVAADRVAEALAAALAAAEARWPRGRVEPAAAAAIARERAEAEMRAADGRAVAVFRSEDTAWTVVRESDAALRASPLHRFVRVHPAPDVAAAIAALEPQRARLAAVAIAGFGETSAALAGALASLGASRVCALGTLQTPPLGWPRDGRAVLRPFARSCRIEVA